MSLVTSTPRKSPRQKALLLASGNLEPSEAEYEDDSDSSSLSSMVLDNHDATAANSAHMNLVDAHDAPVRSARAVPTVADTYDYDDMSQQALSCCIPLLSHLDLSSGGDDPWSKFKPSAGKLSDATLRLFESEWFNMSMAISYLNQYRDEDVQRYLCMRMKVFDSRTIEFWLPQLIALYLQAENEEKVNSHLANFIVERCSRFIKFALVTWWWLTAHIANVEEGSLEGAAAQILLERIENTHPQFPLAMDDIGSDPDARMGEHPSVAVDSLGGRLTLPPQHRRSRSSGAELTSDWYETATATASSAHVGAADDGTTSRTLSRTFSSEDLVLDSGQAFNWPALPRSHSSMGLAALVNESNPRAPSSSALARTRASAPTATGPLTDSEAVTTGDQASRGKRISKHTVPAAVAEEDDCALPAGHRASVESCTCNLRLADCMRAQQSFVAALLNIASKLVQYKTKDMRRTQLYAELALINLNLPARVYLPLCNVGSNTKNDQSNAPGDANESGYVVMAGEKRTRDHHVVRFPPQEAAILNSRDRVPYLLYVEVVDCDQCHTSELQEKLTLPHAHHSGVLGGGGCPHPSPGAPAALSSAPHSPAPSSVSLPTTPATTTAAFASAAAESHSAAKDGYVAVSEIRRNLSKAVRAPKFADRSDPSARAFKEPWCDKLERIRRSSPYGHLPNWHLVPTIVKSGDDLRQELLGSQLMSAFQGAWEAEKLKLWIRPLQILVTSGDGGLIEVVGSAVSVHQIKMNYKTLLEYFKTEFGAPTSEAFLVAQRNFAESLAGYCLFCYFVQVKDRHNSNILLDGEGHILHIDLGFMLSASNSPGGGMNFENAPFKLTNDHIEVLGGWESDMLKYFRILVLQGFIAARKHIKSLMSVIEVMLPGSQLPCMKDGDRVLSDFHDRFQVGLTEEKLDTYVDQLVTTSLDSLRTALYDQFQYYSNGIL
eukprot:m.327453 g.327453  ORF g.327453 m.327453 type:complete len:947 (+) comp20413_c0_seq1:480-3320(+)